MKQLYYVRHGQSFANVYDHFSTKVGAEYDLPLTPLGRTQAEDGVAVAIAEGIKIDKIICSPLVRAQETAAIFAKELGYPPKDIVTSDLVIELQFGVLEGTPWNTWWDKGNTYANLNKVDGAETIEVMQQRAEKTLVFLKSFPEDNVLVVAHSAFGRALKRVIDGRPYTDEFLHVNSLPHGEILKFI